MNLNSMCYQTRERQLYNTPAPRVTPINPYELKESTDPNYNFNIYNNQLNMRRKAETLSYHKVQSNGITKNGKYSKIVSINYRGKNLYCPADDTIPTPTSSCDVPGPIQYLYKDNSIPLYNFATNINAYSLITQQTSPEWSFYPIPDVFCKPYTDSFTETTIAKLIINDTVKSSYNTFNFSTPISIYASGSNLLYSSFDISFNMSYMPTCSVYFSNNKVNNISPMATSPTNIVSIHGSKRNTTYSAYIYYGMVNVTNLTLYTEPGFVYDIKMSFPLRIIPSDSSVGSNSFFGIYCNLQEDTYKNIISSTPNTYSPIECRIDGQISTNYQEFNANAA